MPHSSPTGGHVHCVAPRSKLSIPSELTKPASISFSLSLTFLFFFSGGRGRDCSTASSLPRSLPHREAPSCSDFAISHCCLGYCKMGLPQLSPHSDPHSILPLGQGSRKKSALQSWPPWDLDSFPPDNTEVLFPESMTPCFYREEPERKVFS